MNTLVFATNNQHKVDEIRLIIPAAFHIITLREAGIDIDIAEPHDSLEANATEKSSVIYAMTGKDCFSEDTGLEVEALDGEPGVKSARYAGEDRSFEKNIDKVLSRLEKSHNRKARFRTVISLIMRGEEYQFEGICNGTITTAQKGESGFGYDPIFMPGGSTRTFAEMDTTEKNSFSHRKKAMEKLISFLNKQQ